MLRKSKKIRGKIRTPTTPNPNMNKCIFLDRDGVINVDVGDYVMKEEEYVLEAGVPEALRKLKDAGYLLVVITNQAGIAKGLYGHDLVTKLHATTQEQCDGLLDALYYSPYHESVTASLSRKPDSLMIEKAMARFAIDPAQSWMVGDRMRDLVAAEKVGIKGVFIGTTEQPEVLPRYTAKNLLEAVEKYFL